MFGSAFTRIDFEELFM